MAKASIPTLARPKFSLALILVLIACSGLSLAQESQPETQKTTTPTTPTTPTPPPASDASGTVPARDALGGPTIAVEPRHSLVEYVYGGGLRELDLPAGEAALELLNLDESVADKVAHVLAQRAQLTEKLIIDNFDFLSQGETINASDNKLAQGIFILRALVVFEPLVARGRVENEIRSVLPPDKAREYARLLGEYWDAYARAELAKNGQRITRRRIKQIIRKARFGQFEQEVELAVQRTIDTARFQVGYLLRDMDLTEAQKKTIHTLVVNYVTKNMGQPSEDDGEKLYASIIAFLNEHQREVLAERIKGF